MPDTTSPPDTDQADDLDEVRGLHANRIHAAQETIERAEAEVAKARRKLEDRMFEAHADGLSYAALGDITGYTKQHAGDLVVAARDRTA